MKTDPQKLGLIMHLMDTKYRGKTNLHSIENRLFFIHNDRLSEEDATFISFYGAYLDNDSNEWYVYV